MGLAGASYSNIQITGTNTKKIIIIVALFAIYYYVFYISQNQQISAQDIQTFLGDTLFLAALRNSPLIFL